MEKVLIVDDDGDLRAIVRDVLKEEGFFTLEAKDGINAIKVFKTDTPDVVLLDLKMPYMDGIETMQKLRKIDPSVPVIILTAHGDIPTAVEAIKLGAYDFTSKPPEFDRLIITLKRAAEKRTLDKEVERVNVALEMSLENLFGISDAMKIVINKIRQVAETNFSVIIQGETGTGKSYVASAIHNLSKRAEKPFVRMDIGLIPGTLVESELFGYKKGAFTGAEKDRDGYFKNANGGTIFIDDIENMSAYIQSKFLSVIDEKKIYPIGSAKPVDLDVRVISATNRDINEKVEKKDFREDLFYRLGEFIFTLPPLRERAEDIIFFAEKFLLDSCTELNKNIREISRGALDLMMQHSWPGNLRELRNVIRRATLLTESNTIGQECIEFFIKGNSIDYISSSVKTLKDAVRELEKKKIQEALEITGGNKTRAAELLDISYPNLLSKIKEYDIKYSGIIKKQ